MYEQTPGISPVIGPSTKRAFSSADSKQIEENGCGLSRLAND
jgi:hypothetical protein